MDSHASSLPKPRQSISSRIASFFDSHQRFRSFVVLGLSMLGVITISQLFLFGQSLRLDEAQSMWQTSHSIGDTLRVVAQDVHVPLYHVILHFWQLYFGNSLFTVRLLSLLFLLATIPVVYMLGKQVLRPGWALFAASVYSLLPFMNWYGSEGRMYTLLAFFATVSQLYFVRIIQGKKSWRGYGLTAIIGAYSHYFFSFNLATQGIFYLANRKQFARGSLKRFIIVAALVVASLLPWLLYFHSLGSGKNTSPLLTRPSTVDFFNVFSQFVYGYQDNYVNTVLVSCWPLLVLIAFFGIKRGQKLSLAMSYIITAALAPVIIAFLFSFVVSPFFLSRYMISSVAPLVILIVWLISNYSHVLSRVVSGLLVLVVLATSVQQYASPSTPVKEDYHGVATAISKQAGPQDVVVLSAPFTIYPFEYYYNGSAQIATLPMWDRRAAGAIPAFSEQALPGQVASLNKNHRYIYLVLSQNQGYENTIKQYYLHHFKQVSHHSYSPDLTLYVFQVGYYTVPPLGDPDTLIKSKPLDAAQ